MRKNVELIRLLASGLKAREVARSCGISHTTVGVYRERLNAAGITWPLPDGLNAEELEAKLFPERLGRPRDAERPLPDWKQIHHELTTRKGVTLNLLWKEYRVEHPATYAYSQFCEHYRRWAGTLDVCLRQTYVAGERLFVDYAGMTMPLTDTETGVETPVQIFVAALGASHYLYAEATRTQQLPDWTASHVRTFTFLGGVPAIVIPDNLKSAVSKACRYEPDINPAYQELAQHYGTAIIPARPVRPQDKAKVETGVQIVEREILAPLRNHRFFTLGELNTAIQRELKQVNERPLQVLDVSRKQRFEELDRPALKPLPVAVYEYAEFHKARVNIDYHVEIRRHYYSVPYTLRGEQLDVRLTARLVEMFQRGKRVAAHQRDDRAGSHTTLKEHMPKAHQEYLAWTPSRILEWAGTIGPDCMKAIERIIQSRQHPEQGYRAAMGIIRLGKAYTAPRVNAACVRAMRLDVCNFQSIQSILKTGKDQEPLPEVMQESPILQHENIRGAGYYHVEATHVA